MIGRSFFPPCNGHTPLSIHFRQKSVLLVLAGLMLLEFLKADSAALFGAEERSAEASWRAGFARVVITPNEPMFAAGYGGRSKPSEGKIHDLYARAAVLQDPAGHRAIFVALDLIGVPKKMADFVATAVKRKYGIERADLMLCSSHTHCGPALDDKLTHMLDLKEKDWAVIRRYQHRLNALVLQTIDKAMADLKPARLAVGRGKTGFAVNRRPPIGLGPIDHDVPVLRITNATGEKIRGVIFGYACHNTVMSFYHWCGDYAGFAQLTLENQFPAAVALFFSGCGGDQNPLPRRKIELAEKYGRMLAEAVRQVVSGKMNEVRGPLLTAFEEIELDFDRIPPRSQWEADLKNGNRYLQARARLLLQEIREKGNLPQSHPYPIQVWQLGRQVTWIALGGEVVVDYSLRLKKELGRERTWVAGYANHVMAYIPSERVLREGGYEGDRSMIYYQLPTRWKAGLEDRIVQTVVRLSRQLREAATQTH